MNVTTFNSAKYCWGVAVGSGTKKLTGVLNRVFFNTEKNDDTELTVGDAETLKIKSYGTNQDIILGSMFSNTGTTANKAWCSDALYNLIKTSATTAGTFKAQAGFGPRGKCTW